MKYVQQMQTNVLNVKMDGIQVELDVVHVQIKDAQMIVIQKQENV